jgi:zinc protease
MTDPGENAAMVTASEERHGVTILTLRNGLKVILKEDHRSPLVICHVWVRVGSNFEPEPLRGWAHGIEHMLFKGTRRRAERDFALEVAAAGGSTNAGTGYETTSYHILVPGEHLHQALDILADALFEATFAPEALDAERQVLVHENHMYDDQPGGFGVTWRWGLETAFRRSPYRHPIGGRDERLLQTERASIVDFYRAAYRPDNMTVIIVGDITREAALRNLGATFALASGRQDVAWPQPPLEPPQDGLRMRWETGDLQKAYAKLIFHGPSELDPQRPVLSVLERILADGRSCRLYRIVQERHQLVSDIAMFTETGPREGIVVIDFETEPERLGAALRVTAQLLADLKQELPTEGELTKAKLRIRRSWRFKAETVQGQSDLLGYHDAMGDLETAFLQPERVEAVRAEDVARLCRGLFRADNLSVILYTPRSADPAALGWPTDMAAMQALMVPILGEPAAVDQPDGEPAKTPPAATPSQPRAATRTERAGSPPAASPFRETTLPNGLRVCLRVDRSVPVWAMAVYAIGGSCWETGATAGLAYLTHHVQVKGAKGADAETIHDLIESRGASLTPHPERDYGGLFISSLSDHNEGLLEQLGELACLPSFPADELTRERRLCLQELQAIADDPFRAAARRLRTALYGDHPYSHPIMGTEESLPGLSREQLEQYHRRVWVSGNLLVVVSGDIEPDQWLRRLEDVFAPLPHGPACDLPDLSLRAGAAPPRRERLTKDIQQSVLFVGWPGPSTANDDRVELMLLKELLNGQSGRLFEALRNRRSLCYSCGLISTSGHGPGLLAGYVLTDPQSEDAAVEVLLAELEEIGLRTAGAAEFERARAKLIGHLLIGRQANAARVIHCAQDLLYGRGPDHLQKLLAAVRSCTPEAVRDAAARYLDGDQRREVVLSAGR